MVKWVCQIVTPIRHRALVFNTRLFAGTAADDALVTGSTLSFCRLMCLCVKRRNIMLNDKRRSLLNSALFRADNRTRQKTFSPFSLALIFTFDFAALSERRSCPEDRSRRFVPVGTLTLSRSCGTSPENISRSDGHAIFKVQVRLQDHFSEKYSPLPYIQEVGKRAEKRRFPRLWTRPERAEN